MPVNLTSSSKDAGAIMRYIIIVTTSSWREAYLSCDHVAPNTSIVKGMTTCVNRKKEIPHVTNLTEGNNNSGAILA